MIAAAGLAAVLALSSVGAAPAEAPALPDPAALRTAASEGRLDAVRVLLDAGTPIDAKGPQDWTALHAAVIAGQAEAASLLLERGADPNARGRYDLTPLHWAAMKGRADLAKLLTKRGAKADARDLWARTPLHVAANDKVVRALVELGADVNAQDGKGVTALHVARNEDVANVLLELKADLRLRAWAGLTALELEVAPEPLDKGLQVVTPRKAVRLQGERANFQFEVRNLTDKTIEGLGFAFSSPACEAKLPNTDFQLQPGELALPMVFMVRNPGAREGVHPLSGTMTLGGAEVAKLELTVDTTPGVTPEDQGMIHLGSGSLRRAPGAWANVAFVLGPLVLLGLWFGARWWTKGRQVPKG
ncbi:MAG TPA: ankyrin repeat domain-containing protein [Myxococcales bacterium]